MSYLYGASVQGIQSFLFETNKLKEIAGASEIVDQVCSQLFRELLGRDRFQEENLLIGAAGNIKYIFEDRDTCRHVVRNFPMKVMKLAPGITVSQAVVQVQGVFGQEHIRELENRLRIQRNRPVVQHGLGWMVAERSRRTGKPGVAWEQDQVVDQGQLSKRDASEDAQGSLLRKVLPDSGRGYHHSFPNDMSEIVGRGEKNSWIAIIHADGNDLGKRIIKMSNSNPSKETFKSLSQRITRATEKAVQDAFRQVVLPTGGNGRKYPFRPVVLGGDDLTAIIRGDLAVKFTKVFLSAFEKQTKEQFADFEHEEFRNGLTACAGIAFIKVNYPFHYGVHLAEKLCTEAKKVARKMQASSTPSCLLFHKVHSSFVEDYPSILEKEYTTPDKLRMDYGPYFLLPQENYSTVDDLMRLVKLMNEKASPRSRLRNWLTELQENKASADRELDRIRHITAERYRKGLALREPFTHRNGQTHTHLFDAITLSSIVKNNGE